MASERERWIATIVTFVESIGIEVRCGTVPVQTALPGIDVVGGAIVYDSERLAHPGDLLHEAGHLAVLPAAERARGPALDAAGDEMASIAWSYAAALHLGLDPAIVFHAEGYRGDSAMIIENFAAGRTFGVPLLAWYGLTRERKRDADHQDSFPRMLRWTRDT